MAGAIRVTQQLPSYIMPNMDYILKRTILSVKIAGDDGVGKTALAMTYKKKEFEDTWKSRPHDFCHEFYGKNYDMLLWDYPFKYGIGFNMDVVLLCFAVNSQASYENIKYFWVDYIREEYPYAKIVIVATKIDLRKNEKLKCLSLRDGLALKTEVRADAYMETSALEVNNIDVLFDITVLDAFHIPMKKIKPKYKCCLC